MLKETSIANRYEIIGMLGKGGMGSVYRVLDSETKKELACKVMHEKLDNEQALQRFSAEFKVTSQLHHPNIVTAYDFGFLEDGRPFYTLELIHGKTLETFTREKGGFRDLFAIIFDVCLALDRIHQAGLVHNDVKDRNIMIDENQRGVLMDLGLVCTGLSGDGNFKGTIGYAAPEIIRGETYDHRSDLYSLGVVIYRCLSGQLHVNQESIGTILNAQLTGDIVPLHHRVINLDPRLVAAIHKLLSIDPFNRFASAGDLISELAQIPETGFSEKAANLTPAYGIPEDFIGREDFLEQLQKPLFAPSPETQLQLLIGPEGIGKTRLARELKISVQTNGLRFIHVSATKAINDALYVIRSVISYALHERGREADQIAANSSQWLAMLFPEEDKFNPAGDSFETLEMDLKRQNLISGLAICLTSLISDKSTVLFVDDFQNAGAMTVRWISSLLTQKNTQYPFLIILAAEVPAWTDKINNDTIYRNFLNQFQTTSNQIHLETLTYDEIQNFLVRRFDSTLAEKDFIDRLMEETGGNPMFLELVIRDLIERKKLYRKSFRWTFDLKSLLEIPVAGGMQEILIRRLNLLGKLEYTALQVLSIFPGFVSFELVQQLFNEDFATTLKIVKQLVDKGFAREKRVGSQHYYGFHQNQFRTIVYGKISEIHRTELHHNAAVLIRKSAEKENSAALAYHFARGGDLDQAIRFSYKAGTEAADVFAFEEASEYFINSLKYLKIMEYPKPNSKNQYLFATYNRLAQSYSETGETWKAEDTLLQYLHVASEFGHISDRIRILQNLAVLKLNQGLIPKAEWYFQEAEGLLTEEHTDNPSTRYLQMGLLLNCGILLMQKGRLEEAKSHFFSVMKLSETDHQQYFYAAAAAHLDITLGLNLEKSNFRQEALRLAINNKFHDIRYICMSNEITDLIYQGKISSARTKANKLIQDADKYGSSKWRLIVRLYSLPALLWAGAWCEATALLTQINALQSKISIQKYFDRLIHAAGSLELFKCNFSDAITYFNQALEKATELEKTVFHLEISLDLIQAEIRSGLIKQAESRLQSIAQKARELNLKRFESHIDFLHKLLIWESDRPTWRRSSSISNTTELNALQSQILEMAAAERTGKEISTMSWQSLYEIIQDQGIHYLSVQLVIYRLNCWLKGKQTLRSQELDQLRTQLLTAREFCFKNSLDQLRLELDQLHLAMGKRVCDPEIVYQARKNIECTAGFKGAETQMIQNYAILSDTVDLESLRKSLIHETDIQLTQEMLMKLAQDSGGQALLHLLKDIQQKMSDSDL